jgi:hypothetical protein
MKRVGRRLLLRKREQVGVAQPPPIVDPGAAARTEAIAAGLEVPAGQR